MLKFVEYKKMSKKSRKKMDTAKRRLWSDFGVASPISRVHIDKKKEKRKYACR